MSRSVLTLLIGLLLTPLTPAGEGPSRSEQRFLISLARDTRKKREKNEGRRLTEP